MPLAVLYNVKMCIWLPAETYTIDFVNSTGVHAIVSDIHMLELQTLFGLQPFESKLEARKPVSTVMLCTSAMSTCDRQWLHDRGDGDFYCHRI